MILFMDVQYTYIFQLEQLFDFRRRYLILMEYTCVNTVNIEQFY